MKFDFFKDRNKLITVIGSAFAGITILGIAVAAFFKGEAPDPKQLGPDKKVRYMASKSFARLPEKEKEKYVSQLGRSGRRGFKAAKNMTPKERQAVFKNVRKLIQKKMKERIKKFKSMSKDEQNAFLDEMIARRKKFKDQMKKRMAEGKKGGKGPGGGNRNAMRQGFLESMDSTTRAEMTEFRKRLKEREKQTSGK